MGSKGSPGRLAGDRSDPNEIPARRFETIELQRRRAVREAAPRLGTHATFEGNV